MGDGSKIEWTDASWNPIRGCSAVSPGCANCYAAEVAARFSGVGQAYEGLAVRGPRARWSGKVRLVPEHLADPLRWQRPRLVFTNSMSDMFHESLRFEDIAVLFGVMAAAQHHVFQVLTKRAARMAEWFQWYEGSSGAGATSYAALEVARPAVELAVRGGVAGRGWRGVPWPRQEPPWPLPNVWLGVSTKDQQRADERIPLLLQCPAAVRWISAEPLLGPIDLHEARYPVSGGGWAGAIGSAWIQSGLDWVVVGGESGSRARVCNLDWIGRIVLDCRYHGVPVFVKQLGSRVEASGGVVSDVRRSDGSAPVYIDRGRFVYAHPKGGDLAEFPPVLRVRQYPAVDRSLPCSAAVPR